MTTRTCQGCGFANRDSAVFCGRCGEAIGKTCPACGSPQAPEGLPFCTSCGARLSGSRSRAERKVVSVLFVDLVGFTSMSEQLDPEDVRGILDPYYETVSTQLVRYGGTVEKFIGDAVMALFGAPLAHEDDPERAVRAGYAVCRAVRELREKTELPELAVRVGITTGEAIVARGARPQTGEAMAHGDVVNTAARLQSKAPVDGILVDARTYRATRRQIGYRAADPIEARGKREPVPVWEVVAPRARLGVDRVPARRPLVGRQSELAALSGALDAVTATGSPHVALVVGPAGIGKSRLVGELFQHVDSARQLYFWRQGRSLPYGDGVSFWGLGEIVKAQVGILAGDSAATVREKLRLAVEDTVRPASDVGWVAGHLGPLAGLPGEREPRGDSRSEAFAAWRRFFEGLASKRPLVLVFEDIHWADEGQLEFVSEHLGSRAEGPILVVATCRPELLEQRPHWAHKRGVTTIELAPLSAEDTARLVSSQLGGRGASAELTARLVGRTAGNPLWTEEYVRMLLDRGVLEERKGLWELSGDELPLPDSVQAIIAARLDALADEEKLLVQDAAVIGKSFWLGSITALGDRSRSEAQRLLAGLEQKQVLRLQHESVVVGEPQYSFLHVLVRDVAYNQIARGSRAEKHRRAAAWIESLSAERSEDRAEMLAHHYVTALELARTAREDTGTLSDKARLSLRDVGDRATSLTSFAKAATFYRRALELWPAEAPSRTDLLFRLGRAELRADGTGYDALVAARDGLLAEGSNEQAAEAMVALGELLWIRGDPEALAQVRQASGLVAGSPLSSTKAYVAASLARFLMIHGEHDAAVERGRDALAMAEELDSAELQAHALATTGLARTRSGDSGGLSDLERSIDLAVSLNSIECVRGYANLGNALVEAGELDRAFLIYERGRAAAGRFGDADRIRWFDAERIYEHYWRGSWDEALELADAVVSDVEAGLPTSIEQDARLVRSRIRAARDEPVGAIADAERSVELGRRADYPEMLVPALALRARLAAEAGSTDEAAELLSEVLELWPKRVPPSYWLADLAFAVRDTTAAERLRTALGVASGGSRWIEAAGALLDGELSHAAEHFAAIGTLPDEALACLLSALAAEGDLEPATVILRSLGATAYVRLSEPYLPR